MVKFPEADARKFHNIFICRKCKSKIRAPSMDVLKNAIQCRKCKRSVLRPKRKK